MSPSLRLAIPFACLSVLWSCAASYAPSGVDAAPEGGPAHDDRDGDRIPDDIDPDPDRPAEVLFEDDFDAADGGPWRTFCDRGCVTCPPTPEEPCECAPSRVGGEVHLESWFEGAYDVPSFEAEDLFVSVRVSLAPRSGRDVDWPGAGPYVRAEEDGGSLHACLLLDDSSRGETVLDLARGSNVLRECPERQWSVLDETRVGTSFVGEWVTLAIVARGTDISCRVVEVPELTAAWVDVTPARGSFGIGGVSIGRTAFDDFVAMSLE